ncbi:MAG: hypothetical protein HGB03_01770 [Candidatus Yonathbacteria bacterium]|nr:hypothetical protein [Candidatus Yonathbacteria bacterium]NTW47987.1 hypothetical protein [Candidatus Yonathbacteria bacterium]
MEVGSEVVGSEVNSVVAQKATFCGYVVLSPNDVRAIFEFPAACCDKGDNAFVAFSKDILCLIASGNALKISLGVSEVRADANLFPMLEKVLADWPEKDSHFVTHPSPQFESLDILPVWEKISSRFPESSSQGFVSHAAYNTKTEKVVPLS